MPNASAFNPYREWLGIRASGSLTYYQLLGVKRQDTAERIRVRATKRIQQLHGIDATGREEQRDRLIEKVKLAASVLMDAEQRTRYDRRLAAKRNEQRREAGRDKLAGRDKVPAPSPAPAPAKPRASGKGNGSDKSNAIASKRAKKSSKKKVATKPTPTQAVRHTGEKNVTDELMRLRPRRQNIAPAYRTQQRRSKARTISVLLGLLSMCGIGYLVLTQTSLGNLIASANPTTKREQTPPSPLKGRETKRSDATRPVSIGAKQPEASTSSSVETAMPDDAASPRGDASAVDGGNLPNAGEVASMSDATMQNPHHAQVMATFEQVRELLGERKTDLAKSKLEEARPLATDSGTQMMFRRLETLTNYVEAYWKAADDLLNSFKSGNEAMIGNQRVMVVEKTDERVVIRFGGKNQTIVRDELPSRLAMKLADTWFDADAASSKVFRGAMMAVTDEFAAEDARQLWREAEASGEINLGDLEQVLDDQYE